MADDVDYGALMRQRDTQRAAGAVASTYGVAPQQAATAIEHGPAAGVPPGAGMYQPDEVRAQAQQVQQGAVLQRSPAVAAWVAQADPAHVAASKDDLTSLERIHTSAGQYWQKGGPLGDIERAQLAAFAQSDLGKQQMANPKDFGQWLVGLGNRVGGELGYYGSPFAAIGNPLGQAFYPVQESIRKFEEAHGIRPGNPFMQRPTTNEQWAAEALGAGNVAASALPLHALLPKGRGLAAAGAAGEAAGEAAPGFVPPHQPTPGGGFATNGEGVVVDAAGQPVHFPDNKTAGLWAVRANQAGDGSQFFELGQNGPGGSRFVQDTGPRMGSGVPGRGASEAADFARAAVAEQDAASVAATREAVEASPTFARSSSTIESFLDHTVSDRVVQLEPESLIQLAAEGHDLSGLQLGNDLARSIATGDPVEVPYSRYVTASAGQPWAEALDKAATFREGGISLELAKDVGKPVSEEELAQQTAKGTTPETPADLTAEESDKFRTLAAAVDKEVQRVFREQYLTEAPIEHSSALGMTEAEMAKYGDEMRAASEEARQRAVDAVYRQILRERKPDWQAAVAKHTEAARTELEGQNHIAAYRILSEEGSKLDRDYIKAAYPDLAARIPNLFTSQLGHIPDVFAETLDYGSGREMLNDLAFLHQAVKDSKSSNLSSYLDKRAKLMGQQRAAAELGSDFYSPEAIERLAQEAVPPDRAEGTLITELQQLAAANGGKFLLADVKAQAKELFQQQRVGDVLNPQRLNERIRRLGEKAERALLKEHFGAAWGYKQLQFQRRLQLREALKFQTEFRKTVKVWGKLAGARTLANVDQQALNMTHTVLAQMGYPVSSHIADLPSITQLPGYIAGRNQLGAEVVEAPIPPRDPSHSSAQYIKGLTVEQFSGLHDMVKSIVQDGRNQQQVLRNGVARAADDVRVDMVRSIDRYKRDIPKGDNLPVLEKLDALRRGFDAWLVRGEQLMLDLGGRNPDSPFFENVTRPLQEAKGWKDDALIKLSKHFDAVNKAVGKSFDDWLTAQVVNAHQGTGFFPVLGDDGLPLFNTNKDIMVAALHMGDAQALRKFAEGYDTSPAAIEAIVHKHMTDAAWTAVEGFWRAFEMFAPDVQAAYLRRTGVHLQMVEPRPFEVPSGSPATEGRKLAGGYFPINYDFDNLPQHVQQIVSNDDVLGASDYRTFLPSSRYTKARTGFSAPVDMSLDLIYTRLRQMLHDVAFRDVLVDMQKLLLHKDVTDAISQKYGPEYVEKIRDDIRAIAGAESGGGKGYRAVSRAVNYLTTTQQVSLIGFNPGTVLKHGLTAGFHTMQTVGVGPASQAAWTVFTNPKLRAQLDAESSELRHRNLNANEQARLHFEKLQGRNTIIDTIVRASHWAISELDKESARWTYMAAKQQELDRQAAAGQTPDTAKATALGNQAVRQAHGSTGVTDAPAALRPDKSVAGAFYAALTRFQNFLNHNYNRMREIPQAFGYAGEAPDVPRALGLLLTYVLITGGVGAILAGEFVGAKKGINWLGGIAHGLGHVTTDNIPGFSEVSSGFDWVAGGMHGKPRGSMLLQYGYMYGAVMADLSKVMSDKHPGPKARKHAQQLIADATAAGLTTFRLPGNIVAKGEHLAFDTFDPQANPKRKAH